MTAVSRVPAISLSTASTPVVPTAVRLGVCAFAGACSAPLLANKEPDSAQLSAFNALPDGALIRVTRETKLEEVLGSGPLVDALVDWQKQLSRDDRKSYALALPLKKTVAGELGAVTAAGDGNAVSLTRTKQSVGGVDGPWLDADVVLKVTKSGNTNGDADEANDITAGTYPTVQVSLDGGRSYIGSAILKPGSLYAKVRSAYQTYDLSFLAPSGSTVVVAVGGSNSTGTVTAPTRPSLACEAISFPLDLTAASAAARTMRVKFDAPDEYGTVAERTVDIVIPATSYANQTALVAAGNAWLAANDDTDWMADGQDYADFLLFRIHATTTKFYIEGIQYGTDMGIEVDYVSGTAEFGGLVGDSPTVVFAALTATSAANAQGWLPALSSRVTAVEAAAMLAAATGWSAGEPTWDTSVGFIEASHTSTLQFVTGTIVTALGFPTTLHSVAVLADYKNGYAKTFAIPHLGLRVVFPTATLLRDWTWSFSTTGAKSSAQGAGGFLEAMDRAKTDYAHMPFESYAGVSLEDGFSDTTIADIQAKIVAYAAQTFPVFVALNGPAAPATTVELDSSSVYQDLLAVKADVLGIVGVERAEDATGYRTRSPIGAVMGRLTAGSVVLGEHCQATEVFGALAGYPVTVEYPRLTKDDVARSLSEDYRIMSFFQAPGNALGVYISDDPTMADPEKNLVNLRMLRLTRHAQFLLSQMIGANLNASSSTLQTKIGIWQAALDEKLRGGGRNWCDAVTVTGVYLGERNVRVSVSITKAEVMSVFDIEATAETTDVPTSEI